MVWLLEILLISFIQHLLELFVHPQIIVNAQEEIKVVDPTLTLDFFKIAAFCLKLSDGSTSLLMAEYDFALESYNKFLLIKEKIKGKESAETGGTINNIFLLE